MNCYGNKYNNKLNFDKTQTENKLIFLIIDQTNWLKLWPNSPKKSFYKTKKYLIFQNLHCKEILSSQTMTKLKKTQNIRTEEEENYEKLKNLH